jgi:hypothetical protein
MYPRCKQQQQPQLTWGGSGTRIGVAAGRCEGYGCTFFQSQLATPPAAESRPSDGRHCMASPIDVRHCTTLVSAAVRASLVRATVVHQDGPSRSCQFMFQQCPYIILFSIFLSPACRNAPMLMQRLRYSGARPTTSPKHHCRRSKLSTQWPPLQGPTGVLCGAYSTATRQSKSTARRRSVYVPLMLGGPGGKTAVCGPQAMVQPPAPYPQAGLAPQTGLQAIGIHVCGTGSANLQPVEAVPVYSTTAAVCHRRSWRPQGQ